MTPKARAIITDLLWLALLLSIAFTVLVMVGCKSTTLIPPDRVDTEEVTTPMPCIYVVNLLATLDLPNLPPYPGEETGDVEIKAWLADLKTTIGKREAKLLGRIEAYELKLRIHNEQEPKCINIE